MLHYMEFPHTTRALPPLSHACPLDGYIEIQRYRCHARVFPNLVVNCVQDILKTGTRDSWPYQPSICGGRDTP